MPITILDIVLLAVMLISGLLAMIRGFMREVLSIASWAAAAIATIYAYPKLLPIAKQYFTNDYLAMGSVVGGVFLGTLILVSILTIKISDVILDSRVGALDRTLGFLFGLGRGLIIVVVAFLFFTWLVPERSQPDWIRKAKSLKVVESTGEWLKALLPDDPEGLYQRFKRKRDEPEQETPAGERSDSGAPGSNAAVPGRSGIGG
jgi:membrane protein required for colicin V production